MHKKLQKFFIYGIVIAVSLSFLIMGFDSYRSRKNYVAATVNGQTIPWDAVERIYNNYYQSLVRTNPNMLRNIEPRLLLEEVRQMLVAQTAFRSESEASGYTINDEQLIRKIITDESFWDNGKFSKSKYDEVLAKAGLNAKQFEHNVRSGMLAEQLQDSVQLSAFTLKPEVVAATKIVTQKRYFAYATMPANFFAKELLVPETAIAEYYQQHQQLFIQPEKVKLNYAVLELESIANTIEPTNAELQAYYTENQQDYIEPAMFKVRHIFLQAAADMEAPALQAVQTKMQEILSKLQKGANFAQLAKQYSEDPNSAGNGGELAFKAQGETVAAFEAAALALKRPGELSPIIRSEFGLHILQLIAHKAATVRDFAAVAASVRSSVQRQSAKALFTEQLQAVEKNIKAKPEATLAELVQTLKLPPPIHTSDFLDKTARNGILADPKVLEAVFRDTTSQAIYIVPLTEQRVCLLQIIEKQPASVAALSAVQDNIRQKLQIEAAAVRSKEFTDSCLEQLKQGKTLEQLARQKKLQWSGHQTLVYNARTALPAELVKKVFTMPRPQIGPLHAVVPLTNGDQLLLSLYSVVNPKLDDTQVQDMQRILHVNLAARETQVVQEALIKQAKIILEGFNDR